MAEPCYVTLVRDVSASVVLLDDHPIHLFNYGRPSASQIEFMVKHAKREIIGQVVILVALSLATIFHPDIHKLFKEDDLSWLRVLYLANIVLYVYPLVLNSLKITKLKSANHRVFIMANTAYTIQGILISTLLSFELNDSESQSLKCDKITRQCTSLFNLIFATYVVRVVPFILPVALWFLYLVLQRKCMNE